MLDGTVISQEQSSVGSYVLDLRGIAPTTGMFRVEGVEVTYETGFLRRRTARLPAPVCVTAQSTLALTSVEDCPLPERP